MSQRFPIELRLQSNLTPLPTRQSKPVSNGLITTAYLLVLGICEVAMTLPNRFLSRAIVMMRMLPLAFLLGDPCCHTAMQNFWWQSNTIDTPHTTLSSFSNLTYFESVSSPRTFQKQEERSAGRQAGRQTQYVHIRWSSMQKNEKGEHARFPYFMAWRHHVQEKNPCHCSSLYCKLSF